MCFKLRLPRLWSLSKAQEVARIMSVDETFSERTPTWLELESVLRMSVAERVTSLSADSIRRLYPDLVVRLSKRRHGLKLRDALAIANGTAKRRA